MLYSKNIIKYMFNIKLENEDVVIKFSLNNGNYDQKNYYKINLSTKQYFLEESGEWVELGWDMAIESLEERIDDIKLEVTRMIFNNRNVIHSYTVENNELGVKKAKKHLEQNILIQDFLNNYEL